MKIRTDFVTNSSSSSFVTVGIGTKNKELLEIMKEIQSKHCYFTLDISENDIFLNGETIDYYLSYKSPITLIESFAELLEECCADNPEELIEKLRSKKREFADSIAWYTANIEESGNAGEGESLWEEYINFIIASDYADSDDDDLFARLWDELLESDEWVSKETEYGFDQEEGKVKKTIFMMGPLGEGYLPEDDESDDDDDDECED